MVVVRCIPRSAGLLQARSRHFRSSGSVWSTAGVGFRIQYVLYIESVFGADRGRGGLKDIGVGAAKSWGLKDKGAAMPWGGGGS